jgi:excinuclease UvrABC ATPase subunit
MESILFLKVLQEIILKNVTVKIPLGKMVAVTGSIRKWKVYSYK